MSLRAYARHRGVSHTAVQDAVKAGRIVAVRGKIDARSADALWDANTDPSKPRSVIGKTAPTAKGPVAYAISRALREEIRAKTEALEYARKAGSVVAIEDAAAEWSDRILKARSKAYAAVDSFAPAITAAACLDQARAAGLALLEEFLGSLSKPTDDEEPSEKKKPRKRAA